MRAGAERGGRKCCVSGDDDARARDEVTSTQCRRAVLECHGTGWRERTGGCDVGGECYRGTEVHRVGAGAEGGGGCSSLRDPSGGEMTRVDGAKTGDKVVLSSGVEVKGAEAQEARIGTH